MTRKAYILIGICVLALIGLSIVSFLHARHSSPTYEHSTINPDTGQTIRSTPNRTPENGGNAKIVTVLGDDKFISAGMTQAQFILSEQLLQSYVINQLHGQYSQVSILNAGFTSTGNSITAKMRLGSTSTLLNLTIRYHDLKYVAVSIRNPSSDASFSYDSGEQTAS